MDAVTHPLMNEASTASDIVKKVTVLDAILWLTTAWDSD